MTNTSFSKETVMVRVGREPKWRLGQQIPVSRHSLLFVGQRINKVQTKGAPLTEDDKG